MAQAPTVGYSKRSRIDKLGVKDGMRVALLRVEDDGIVGELRARTPDLARTRPKKDSDMILAGFDDAAELSRLAVLRKSIKPNGAIWAIWPKGQKRIGEDAIRRAAIAVDLVDVKVMAFSGTLSGLKLVIPVAKR
jgi:hypothetical protein